MTEKKHDIAISFLHQEESIAIELESKLSTSFSVFIFPKKQEELGGTDGLESFRDVFRNDSRLVVVLYRDGWGKSKWTRVEEGAITDRFLNEGWQWLLFIMLDSKSSPPKWLPETKIRLDLEEYGIEQCIGAIKARVQELGAVAHHESALDRAKRLEQNIVLEQERKTILTSPNSIASAQKEIGTFLDKLEAILIEIKASTSNLFFDYGRKDELYQREFVIRGQTTSLSINWSQKYSNALDGAQLWIGQWNGRINLPGKNGYYPITPKEYNAQSFDPDYLHEFGWCWHASNGKHFTSAQLAEHCADLFLNSIKNK